MSGRQYRYSYRKCCAAVSARLLSPDMDWFNGATIDFSGGMMLRLIDMVLNEEGA